VIEFENVNKVYDNEYPALQDINLSIARGEFLFLTGPSGAGKSTLLKLLYRDEEPSSGRVIIEGTDVTRIPDNKVPLLRRKMGIIFQDFKLLYDRSVFDNVAFALEVIGMPAVEIRRETEAVLEKVGLSSRAKLNPHKLSGGEQQRVAVARALVHDPGLILADEPTGNLDAETSWGLFELLNQAHERGTTIVVASHDEVIMKRMNRRVVHLRAGRMTAEDHGEYESV
jgi:cell division transport system ATP-binding protein